MSTDIHVGDVIELGRHRLMCGDAFNPEHVDVLMHGEEPDMLYCDPPYGMGLKTNNERRVRYSAYSQRTTGHVNNYDAVLGDDQTFSASLLIGAFPCREQFWWGADYYRQSLPEGGSWLVWDKRITERSDSMWGSCFELCWSKRPHKRDIARFAWVGVQGLAHGNVDNRRYHPTQKPVALAEWFLDRYSKDGATVVDLFGGSGSTLLACERKGRVCRMMELSPQYCQVIVDRYHALAQQPRLIEAAS